MSKGIDVQVSLQEMQKNGGYRCITLMCQDAKGGEFVENPNLSMMLVEANNKTVLAELSGDRALLQSGPEGLFKRLEIGVNNYDPQEFLSQSFQIYFFAEKEESRSPKGLLVSEGHEILPAAQYETDKEMLYGRIERGDLVAFGEISAADIMQNSVCHEDFADIEPSMQEGLGVKSAPLKPPIKIQPDE